MPTPLSTKNNPRTIWLASWPSSTRKFLRQNSFFLGSCLLLFSVGIYFILTNQIGDILLNINEQRSAARDLFFIILTQFSELNAYITLFLFFALIRYRTAIFLLACGLLAGIVSALLKTLFGYARPLRYLYDNDIERWGMLELFDEAVYRNSWAYTSFPSGHAMSAFALFSFVAFNIHRWKTSTASLCIFLASMVALSRIYLLMHFLRDVVVGGMIGLLIGASLFWAQFHLWPNSKILDRGLIVK